MHLTQFSDYGLRLTLYLACHPDRLVSVEEVGQAYGISRHHLVKVVQVLGLWRKVEDPDGAQGWMHVRLLSDTATAIVTAAQAPMHEGASETSRTLFRAEKGVVGRIGSCSGGWCAFDVKGQKGFQAEDVQPID